MHWSYIFLAVTHRYARCIANTPKLCLPCTNPSIVCYIELYYNSKQLYVVHLENYAHTSPCCVLLWFGAGQLYPYPSRLHHMHWSKQNNMQKYRAESRFAPSQWEMALQDNWNGWYVLCIILYIQCHPISIGQFSMITLWHGNAFLITGPLWGDWSLVVSPHKSQ